MYLDLKLGDLVEPLTGLRWSGAESERRIRARVAQLAVRGFGPGDRAFLHFGNTAAFFVDLLAIWELGGCAVPVDARLKPFEVETLVRAARPRLCLFDGPPDESLAERIRDTDAQLVADPPAPPGPEPPARRGEVRLDRDALILFTSGTTGRPKGVVHTHRSLRARWLGLRQALGTEAFRRTLCLLPTHFGHGLICNCLYPWLSGGELFVLPPFRPDVLLRLGSLLDEHGITFMSSVPSMWRLALKTARSPCQGTLRRVFCGSAALSAHLWHGIRDWTGAAEVFNAYGITETGSWVAGTTVPDFAPEDGLVGEPWGAVIRVLEHSDAEMPLHEARVCDVGEPGYVWIQTPALMQGYFERDDLTRQVVNSGWFFTGDVGFLNQRGWLYLMGREREEINKGGMKVHPADVDAVVERFPETVDVCTFAYADPLHGEDVGVAVVLGCQDDGTLRRLHAWTAEHLASHKVPQRWYLLDELPRTSRGKVNREAISRACADLDPVKLPPPRSGD